MFVEILLLLLLCADRARSMGGHHTCCNKQKVKRGLWSPEEDQKLINFVSTYGHGCWSSVPRLAGIFIFIHIHIHIHACITIHVYHDDDDDDVSCRSAEMWEKLQVEMDQLSEARSQERVFLPP